jgi:hypothetical protein
MLPEGNLSCRAVVVQPSTLAMQETEIYDADNRIGVYLRPLVDDLKILWKPGVKEVWDEYKREELTMRAFTTINDNPTHRNLPGQSKRKGAACPHYLEDICAVCLRHSKKYIFIGHRHFFA